MRPFLLFVVLALPGTAFGQARKLATEAAEYTMPRLRRAVVKDGVQTLAAKIETSAARYGTEVFSAVKKVGPRVLPLLEEAGIHGKQAARILAEHGEAGAVWVVGRPSAMSLAARHGDAAAAVLCKHAGGVAEPILQEFGLPAVRALEAVGQREGRQMAMLAADGTLSKIGRTEEVLEVVAKYGNRGAKFIWENKGSLAIGTTLTAFLLHPEPFLDGAKDITKVVADDVVRPIAEIPGQAVQGVVSGTNWTVVILAVLVGAGLLLFLRHTKHRPAQQGAEKGKQ